MKTVRRLFYKNILNAVVFVTLAFLALFFFIEFTDELADVGSTGYTAAVAFQVALFALPQQFYELVPISLLIGSIAGLSRLAQNNEFTILRTGGMGPSKALLLLMGLGVLAGVLTFVVGDYVAPWAQQKAAELKAVSQGSTALGRTGVWLKDKQIQNGKEVSYSIHVSKTLGESRLGQVRIFEFDAQGRLIRRIAAVQARIKDLGMTNSEQIRSRTLWQLEDASVTVWPQVLSTPSSESGSLIAAEKKFSTLDWESHLSMEVIRASVLPAASLSTVELWSYVGHLANNQQAAQKQELQFWKRALYPLVCLVMMGLALPFAYLQSRRGGIGLKVFGGILLGIGFVLLNNVAGHVGLLNGWTPWVVASAPSIFLLLVSMGAFAWLVRYR
jgi:lipopolysaccharide export system permease protein